MSQPTANEDRDAIVAHVRSIFDAYLRHDRAAIRATHAADWRGFQVGTRRIVRGLDDYMSAAADVLKSLKARRYELLDVEVDVQGDLALCWYVARDWLDDDAGGERPILLRALDVYRREPTGWNPCGSHVSALPEGA
jgi:ketosteroid isomerase-like protein